MNNVNESVFNFNIDTSSLTTTNISSDEFNTEVYDKVQRILNAEFPDIYSKQYIKKTQTGFNFACPYCHDSASNTSKKRGNIVLSGKYAGHFKCFNCGKSVKLVKFFEDFKEPMSLNDITYIKNNLTIPSTFAYGANSTALTSEVIDYENALKYAIPRDIIKRVFNLEEINKQTTPEAYSYLIHRCQYNLKNFLYSRRFDKIIILNSIKNDYVIGYQTRPLKYKNYNTMQITRLRNALYGASAGVIPDYIENLSSLFNIFNINIYKPILVTEGPLDAFLLPNCIATSGASKNLGVDLPFWYVYDSDKTGIEHALDALKRGYNVFMWKKFKQDYNLPYREKWDINDVMMYFRDNNIDTKQIKWQPYFTHNSLDGLNL
jgi:hypothetical protein